MSDRYNGRGAMRRPSPPRNRDDHPDVEYFGAGESYRPGGPPNEVSYRPQRERERDWNVERRDDRRDERRREEIDSYIPSTSSRAQRPRSRSPLSYRHRSRSPPGRLRPELFPDRDRAPRRYSPARDSRPRSPIRRRSRSPYQQRGKTPENRHPQDFSPRQRSPPRERPPSIPRDRYAQPRSPPRRSSPLHRDTNYRPRSRSPARRDDRRPNYAEESWRRRSPSPQQSGVMSAATSRRSSPPAHQDRGSMTGSGKGSPAFHSRSQYNTRRDESYTRPRSPPRHDYQTRVRDNHNNSREQTPRSDYRNDILQAPPSAPRTTSYDRPPPAGPSQPYNASTSPPSGPKGLESNSAHNHNTPSTTFTAPTKPRAARYEQPANDFVSPPGAIRGRTSITYRAPGYRPPSTLDSATSYSPVMPSASANSSAAPLVLPSGPRASSYSSRGDFSLRGRGDFSFRQPSYHADSPYHGVSTNSSSTYPRNQRFGDTPSRSGTVAYTTAFQNGNATTTNLTSSHDPITHHLSTLERIVPGGKRMPSGLPLEQEKRVKVLEEEAEKLRYEVNDRQRLKRAAENEWEAGKRESELAALRSELADQHLRSLTEEEGMVGTAF